MDKPGPLCPFSFGFNVRREHPNLINPLQKDLTIAVGFPCIKEKCKAYLPGIDDCIIIRVCIELFDLSQEELRQK